MHRPTSHRASGAYHPHPAVRPAAPGDAAPPPPGTATRPELRLDALLGADRADDVDLDPPRYAPPRDLEQPTIVSDGVGALVAFVVLVVLLLTFVLWVLPYLLVG